MATFHPLEKGEIHFPHGFLWGASTSSHQVEGNTHNDWSEWEQEKHTWLAEKMNKRYAPWLPAYKRLKNEIADPQNYISGAAADHYHLYEKDFDILQKLNLNAYRFSVEWSRIEPEEGKFDEVELNHYNKMLLSLHQRGIEPFVTLWHWTMPTWVRDQGGWTNEKTIQDYCRFIHKVVTACPSVRNWITLNEPEVYTSEGYAVGHWPPMKRNRVQYFQVLRNLTSAHNYAYQYIKEANPLAEVGIVTNLTFFEPAGNRIYNQAIAKVATKFSQMLLMNVSNSLDFIGLNFYFRTVINIFKEYSPACDVSDLGWELCAYGIYNVLKSLKGYNKPIYITENGLADGADNYREAYIRENLGYMHQAIMEGVDVRGYFHWSLLDNFEWDKGYWPRFGLVDVDFKTQKRTIRESAKAYAKIAGSNSLILD